MMIEAREITAHADVRRFVAPLGYITIRTEPDEYRLVDGPSVGASASLAQGHLVIMDAMPDGEGLRDQVIRRETRRDLLALREDGTFAGHIESHRSDLEEKADQWCREWDSLRCLMYLFRHDDVRLPWQT